MVGKTLRNYRITDKLGVGGQGAVYKATDTKLGRTVVIKVIPPELSVKEANLKRFEREARLASSLDHPNICTIFDLDEVDGVHFIAMQFVEGKNVRQLVAGRPLELKTSLLIGLQVADALAAAIRAVVRAETERVERADDGRLATAPVAGVDIEQARQPVAAEARVLPHVGEDVEAVVTELVEVRTHAVLCRK